MRSIKLLLDAGTHIYYYFHKSIADESPIFSVIKMGDHDILQLFCDYFNSEFDSMKT